MQLHSSVPWNSPRGSCPLFYTTQALEGVKNKKVKMEEEGPEHCAIQIVMCLYCNCSLVGAAYYSPWHHGIEINSYQIWQLNFPKPLCWSARFGSGSGSISRMTKQNSMAHAPKKCRFTMIFGSGPGLARLSGNNSWTSSWYSLNHHKKFSNWEPKVARLSKQLLLWTSKMQLNYSCSMLFSLQFHTNMLLGM